MKVLIHRDPSIAASALDEALLARSHELLHSPPGARDILGAIEREAPALVVLRADPDAAGLCRALRAQAGGADLVLLLEAAAAQAGRLAALLEAGADDFVLDTWDRTLLELRLLAAERLAAERAARRRAEREASQHEVECRAILDRIPAYVWYRDPDGRVLRANRMAAEYLGRTVEQMEGRLVSELYGAYAVQFREEDERILASGEPLPGILEQVVLPGGQARWLQIDKLPHSGPDGRLQGIVVFARDVTEQHRAEAELRASEELNRRILEAVRGGIVHVTLHGAVIHANTEAQRILGLGYDELCHRYVPEFESVTIREDGSIFPVAEYPVIRCLQTGEAQPPTLVGVRRPDGAVSWGSYSAIPLHDPLDGHLTGAIVTFVDLTEHKRNADALLEANQTLRALIEAAPLPIYFVDLQGSVQKVWNTAAERLLGWSAEEVLGQPLPTVLQEGPAAWGQFLESLASPGSLVGTEVRRRKKDGSTVDYAVYSAPLHDHGGHLSGHLTLLVDLTERKRAEQERLKLEAQIQHAQRLEGLGVLAGGIAHDFNNLLVGVLGNADLALMELDEASTARTRIEDIKKAGLQASALTRQMLAYSGKGRFVIEPIQLNALIREMADLLAVSISKRVRLEREFTEPLPPIEGDVSQLRQIVMNLITNASEAIGEANGTIRLRTGTLEADAAYLAGTVLDESLPPGRYVFLEVADDGCGMDEATRSKIFDPFFTTKFTGRGLGLAAVLGIVRGHRGAIEVRSRPGQGTSFRALFPASAAAVAPATRPRPEAAFASQPLRLTPYRARGTVLVVDDEPTSRNVARIMLQSAGFSVLTASDGAEGVETFRAHAPWLAAVLLDLTMPRMSGEEAFAEMQRIRPGVPILLVSGYSEPDVTGRFVGKSLAGFVHKPFQRAELLQKLEEALALAAARRT